MNNKLAFTVYCLTTLSFACLSYNDACLSVCLSISSCSEGLNRMYSRICGKAEGGNKKQNSMNKTFY